MSKLDSLVGRSGRLLTKRGHIFFNEPNEICEALRVETLQRPTLDGFKERQVLVVKDSLGVEHDIRPSQITTIA